MCVCPIAPHASLSPGAGCALYVRLASPSPCEQRERGNLTRPAPAGPPPKAESCKLEWAQNPLPRESCDTAWCCSWRGPGGDTEHLHSYQDSHGAARQLAIPLLKAPLADGARRWGRQDAQGWWCRCPTGPFRHSLRRGLHSSRAHITIELTCPSAIATARGMAPLVAPHYWPLLHPARLCVREPKPSPRTLQGGYAWQKRNAEYHGEPDKVCRQCHGAHHGGVMTAEH